MRTLVRFITAVALSALCASAAMAKGNDTSDFIVNGVILKTSKNSDAKCKLELFHENKLIETSQIKMNKPFERKLKKNVWYTIRITKEGFVPLLISFNTELKDGAKVLDNLFEFETTLIDLKSAKDMNKDQIDFPVGLVVYNKDTQKFEARDIYTANYMTALYKTTPVDATDVAMVYTQAKQQTADIAKDCVVHKYMAAGMC